jgi:hypothetical protein
MGGEGLHQCTSSQEREKVARRSDFTLVVFCT